MRCDPAALRLVAVTDSLRDGVDGLAARAGAAVAGGATMLLLRLKDESARTLVEVARRLRAVAPTVPLIVSGRADVALATGAAGVHLGVDDLPPAVLRRVVPPGFLIGASAADAGHLLAIDGADYVAVGPVFAPRAAGVSSPAIGLQGVAALAARSPVPVVAVGGIDASNAAAVLATGACGVGVISAVLGAADPSRHARAIRDVLDASGR